MTATFRPMCLCLLFCTGTVSCGTSDSASQADAALTIDATRAVADSAPVGLLVFLSSTVASGDSIPSATATCNQLAMTAGHSGEWVAWISTATSDALANLSGQGPWLRSDGMVAFADRASLQVGPSVPIDLNELGEPVADALVYTGTAADGTWSGEDCNDWTSYYPEESATMGRASATGNDWTSAKISNCERPRRFYCFQQEAEV